MATLDWCTIESDPGVFTELIANIGCKDIQVEEMFDLEKESFGDDEIYGLIFLFKYDKKLANDSDGKLVDDRLCKLWFAKQVIVNACATQALVSILMNSPNLNLGDTLKQFKEFTQSFDPQTRGEALSNSGEICKAHNSFARPDSSFIVDESIKDEEGDAYHFVAYLAHENRIYELDGLKPNPLEHCAYDKTKPLDWQRAMREVITKRMNKYMSNDKIEIRFNLLKVVKKRQTVYQEKIDELTAKMTANPSEADALRGQIQALENQILEEKEKFKQWELENTRRRHNYVPMILCYLKHLCKKGLIKDLAKSAFEKQAQRLKDAEQKKKDEQKEKASS